MTLSLISFKQLYKLGSEEKVLNLSSAIFTPFVLGYSFMSIFMFMFFVGAYDSLKWYSFFDCIKKISIILVLILFVLTPFIYLQYKNGYLLTFPLILILLEPFKYKYIFKKDYSNVIERNIILLILSIILLFVSSFVCKTLKIKGFQFMYGGFYYLTLAYLDYLQHKKLKKNET